MTQAEPARRAPPTLLAMIARWREIADALLAATDADAARMLLEERGSIEAAVAAAAARGDADLLAKIEFARERLPRDWPRHSLENRLLWGIITDIERIVGGEK